MDCLQNRSLLEESTSFYPENRTTEVSRSFRAFMLIKGIKEIFINKLKNKGLHEREFYNFRLGTMKKLNSLNIGLPVEGFLREAYIGLFHVLLCLESDDDLSNTSKRLLPHISNALSVIRHVLQKQGRRIPNLKSEASHYRNDTLNHLAPLTDSYLRSKPDYEVLNAYGNLIKNFQIISEIDESLRDLQDKFEELRRQPKQSRVDENPVYQFNDHLLPLLAEMEERVDLSALL